MKLPYGISDFGSLRKESYLYVDKTSYIEQLESLGSKYVSFIRPRRFGKSLFLSTLAHYYDILAEKDFRALFGDLYIGRNPTPLRQHYLVLELDFSGLDTSGPAEFAGSFRTKINNACRRFLRKYQSILGDTTHLEEQVAQAANGVGVLDVLIRAVEEVQLKLYLIVDEYDHFANDIMAAGESAFYRELVRAAGIVRDFYETVKIGTKSAIDRIFITGVSPIMLDDLTSGFNISDNLTMEPVVHDMLGFTEDDLHQVLAGFQHEMPNAGALPDDLLAELRRNYDGYLFHPEGATRLYNPDMVLHFLNQWQRRGRYPEGILDDNVKTDYGRLQRLIASERNRETLHAIIRDESITAPIVSRFSFDQMYDEEYFVSLLFYLGMLTIKGARYGQTELVIPNYAIKTMYWAYFERWLRTETGIEVKTAEVGKAIWSLATEGRLQPFVDFIQKQVLSALSHRDLIHFDEKNMKLLLLSYLNLFDVYRPRSERETQHGYIDLFLAKSPGAPAVVYEWLIELKYLKSREAGRLETVKAQGLRQLAAYAAGHDLAGQPHLRQALLVLIGKSEMVVVEPAALRLA